MTAERPRTARQHAARPPAVLWRRPPPGGPHVPELLAAAAAWSWRLLAVGVVAYLVARLLDVFSVVTVPLIVALLLTALVAPVRDALQRLGLRRLGASWLTFLAGLSAFLGILGFAGYQATTNLPRLTAESSSTLDRIRGLLSELPLGLGNRPLAALQDQAAAWLSGHRESLVSTLYTGADVTVRVVVGVLLTAVLTFLLLYDGEHIWHVLSGLCGPRWAPRVDGAGVAAWRTLSGYVHATLLIATFHGTVIGTTLALLHVPLAVILAVLVFVGSFVPIAGALVAGGAAVLVAAATRGLLDAGIVLGMLILANQVESQLLQPLVMRRFVHVHPIVTVIGITALAAVWGVPGALVAVPSAAILHSVWPVLRGTGLQAEGEEPDDEKADRAGQDAEAAGDDGGDDGGDDAGDDGEGPDADEDAV